MTELNYELPATGPRSSAEPNIRTALTEIRDTINNGELDTDNLKAAAGIVEGQLADGAVTSRKWKPEAGLKECTAGLALTEALQDVAGCSLAITPATPSVLRIYAVVAKEGTAWSEGRLNVDGVNQSARIYVPPATGTIITSGFQVFDFNLTAAAHTIKLQARRVEAGTANALTSSTRFAYKLRSQ